MRCGVTLNHQQVCSSLSHLQDLMQEVHDRARLCLVACTARDAEDLCFPSLRVYEPVDSHLTIMLRHKKDYCSKHPI